MVPKLIHQLVIGPQMNDAIRYCLNSWQKITDYNYQVKVWRDEEAEYFIKTEFPFAYDAIYKARNLGEATDIMKYLIVYFYGGFHIDWDIQLINPQRFIDIAERLQTGFLLTDFKSEALASECFSASPKEPFLLSLVQDIVKIYLAERRDDFTTPQYSGPYRMGWSYEKHKNSTQKIIAAKTLYVYDYSEIRTMPPNDFSAPLIHYWLHTWL